MTLEAERRARVMANLEPEDEGTGGDWRGLEGASVEEEWRLDDEHVERGLEGASLEEEAGSWPCWASSSVMGASREASGECESPGIITGAEDRTPYDGLGAVVRDIELAAGVTKDLVGP